MISSGNITLKNDTANTVAAGSGGSYQVGSSFSPVTIVGWSKTANTIYFKKAQPVWFEGAVSYVVKDNAPVFAARLSRRRMQYLHKGYQLRTCGHYQHTDQGF